MDKAATILQRVKTAGIDMGAVAVQLEKEGIDKFIEPFQKLLDAIEKQKEQSGAT